MEANLIRLLVADVRSAIINKKVNVSSAIDIVTKTMELAAIRFAGEPGATKQKYVITVLTEIAKGQDGIAGTSDDLIPETVMRTLKFLIENDVIEQIIVNVWKAAKGRILPVAKSCFRSCFGQGRT